ncbi:MAG: SoxR reducing system RseC family protein [Clostridia bacterium]|nr:SoxR reducing system RseC family protein [Clostridia bacterium]
MEKLGTVKEVLGADMIVSVVRDSACGDNCAACGLCGNSREMTVRLKNTKGFKRGDRVRLVSEDKKVLGNSALGYLSLTALLIAGGVIGGIFGGDWAAFCGAAVGLALGIGALKLFFKDKIDIEVQKVEN